MRMLETNTQVDVRMKFLRLITVHRTYFKRSQREVIAEADGMAR